MQRIYDEVVNEGNLHVIDELFAETFVEHEVFPGIPPTREGVKQFFTMFRTAFPDVTFEVEHMIGEGVFVAARARCHGTHQGDWMGVPPAADRSTSRCSTWFASTAGSRPRTGAPSTG